MRISEWSSDVCSSDLVRHLCAHDHTASQSRYHPRNAIAAELHIAVVHVHEQGRIRRSWRRSRSAEGCSIPTWRGDRENSHYPRPYRSEEHTSELQSLMRISYAVFCLKKKTT